jgi:hypothetical protein
VSTRADELVGAERAIADEADRADLALVFTVALDVRTLSVRAPRERRKKREQRQEPRAEHRSRPHAREPRGHQPPCVSDLRDLRREATSSGASGVR